MIIIEGKMRVGDEVWGKGHYCYVPPGYAMPEITSEQGCLALVMYNTGAPSHEESTDHHPLATFHFNYGHEGSLPLWR